MGLFSRNKPKIKVQTTKKDGYSGWVKCTHCNDLVHANELQENQHCCPKCNYHYRLSAEQRVIGFREAAYWIKAQTNPDEIVLGSGSPSLAFYSNRRLHKYPVSETFERKSYAGLLEIIKKEKPRFLVLYYVPGGINENDLYFSF